METSIVSETISQQNICGDPENIEIVNDMEPKLTQSKEQTEIEQTRKILIQAQKVYFKYFSSQKMAQMESTIKCRAEVGFSGSSTTLATATSKTATAKMVTPTTDTLKTASSVKHLHIRYPFLLFYMHYTSQMLQLDPCELS